MTNIKILAKCLNSSCGDEFIINTVSLESINSLRNKMITIRVYAPLSQESFWQEISLKEPIYCNNCDKYNTYFRVALTQASWYLTESRFVHYKYGLTFNAHRSTTEKK